MAFISLRSILSENLIKTAMRGSGGLSLISGDTLHEMVGLTRITHRKKLP